MNYLEALEKCIKAKKRRRLLGMRPKDWNPKADYLESYDACAYTIRRWKGREECEGQETYYLVFVGRGTLRSQVSEWGRKSGDHIEGATLIDVELTLGEWDTITEKELNKEAYKRWAFLRRKTA